MKITIPKDWFLSRAALEEGCEIGAGNPNIFKSMTTFANPDMTQNEAEDRTGLKGRSYPLATNPSLRCQLGKNIAERRPNPRHLAEMITVDIFHLVGYGPNWGAAAARVINPMTRVRK